MSDTPGLSQSETLTAEEMLSSDTRQAILQEIAHELDGMSATDLGDIHQWIRAKKAIRQKPTAFIQEMMKFETLGEQDGEYRFQMTVVNELMNRYGMLHGGMMTAFIDHAMGETSFLIDEKMDRAVTLNMTVDFLKPGRVGNRLRAHVRPLQNSRAIIVFQTTIYNEDNEVIATALSHFYKQYKR